VFPEVSRALVRTRRGGLCRCVSCVESATGARGREFIAKPRVADLGAPNDATGDSEQAGTQCNRMQREWLGRAMAPNCARGPVSGLGLKLSGFQCRGKKGNCTDGGARYLRVLGFKDASDAFPG